MYELARELEVGSKDVIDLLAAHGTIVKSHMSVLEDSLIDMLRSQLQKKTAPLNTQLDEQKKIPSKKKNLETKGITHTEKPVATQEKKPAVEIIEHIETIEYKEAEPVLENTITETKEPERSSFEVTPEEEEGILDELFPKLKIAAPITVASLAPKLNLSPNDLIKNLMKKGFMVTINQRLDDKLAASLCREYEYLLEVVDPLEMQLEEEVPDTPEMLILRPPVVTIMGHVDHGKTSLLDALRKTNVTASEAGGITQHIGAYQVELHGRKITFLDTPGHEAFTAMRARGTKITDIAILVVAADDGVMPQTEEAIDHARAANVNILVAINKVDKPNANIDRVKQQLSDLKLLPEDWGGDTICVPVSAKQRQGLDLLLEMILLVADMAEFKANPNKRARGTVIEAKLDKGKGPVATVLVQEGTLSVGDAVVMGKAYGRVRAMNNDRGERIKKALPAFPAEILGLSQVPQAGDTFQVVADEKVARQIADARNLKGREERMAPIKRITLDDISQQIKEGVVKELKVIIKADVHGSAEALKQSLLRLTNEDVRINVIHGGVGGVTESDVLLAAASNAIIIGYNIRPEPHIKQKADNENVDIRLYRVIYHVIDDIKLAMTGMLEPTYEEVMLGRVEVRQVFKISKVGVIAGCYVLDGKITRDADVRVIRDSKVVHEGKLASLRRFKDDVKEVAAGFECGIGVEKYTALQPGDIIEAFSVEAVQPTVLASSSSRRTE